MNASIPDNPEAEQPDREQAKDTWPEIAQALFKAYANLEPGRKYSYTFQDREDPSLTASFTVERTEDKIIVGIEILSEKRTFEFPVQPLE